MIDIDGAEGEGGGQIVRSSLALSLLTGKSFRIFNLRAGRKKPGLKLQHLTAVNAAAEIGNANVFGNVLQSQEISFEPGEVSSGNYRFQIATAGSMTLVFQTLLPPLMMAEGNSNIKLVGGTHNSMAPTFDFLQRSYLPIVNQMGPFVETHLVKHGFYPAGGGEFNATISPTGDMTGIKILERGKLRCRKVRAVVSSLPLNIAARETARVIRKLNWDKVEIEHIQASQPVGPGNVLMAELEYENLTTSFTSFGQRGVTSEKVADGMVREIRNYLKHEAPVGEHLADQLMLPMAVAANHSKVSSQFRTGPPSQHSLTHAGIIQRFLNVSVTVEEDGDAWLIKVDPKS